MASDEIKWLYIRKPCECRDCNDVRGGQRLLSDVWLRSRIGAPLHNLKTKTNGAALHLLEELHRIHKPELYEQEQGIAEAGADEAVEATQVQPDDRAEASESELTDSSNEVRSCIFASVRLVHR